MARAASPAKAIEYETEALRMIEGMRLNLASRILRPEFLAIASSNWLVANFPVVHEHPERHRPWFAPKSAPTIKHHSDTFW